MMKIILLFFGYLISGLSLFIINYYIRESRYEINNLNYFILMISILLVAMSFSQLPKMTHKDITEIEKRNNIKSIIYILIATIIFFITACYDYGEINLLWSKFFITFFFILGIIKINYKLELFLNQSVKDIKNEIKELFKEVRETKEKKTKIKPKERRPIIYTLFDYIPFSVIVIIVIGIHLGIGTLLLELGLGNVLPNYDIYYSTYETTYIVLGLVPLGRIFYMYVVYIIN